MTEIQQDALEAYTGRVRAHYGARLHDIILFGSRARGDIRPESDVDLAIILKDDGWRFWAEKLALADLSYEAVIDAELVVQGCPVPLAAWQSPADHPQRQLINAMKRDARPWRDAA